VKEGREKETWNKKGNDNQCHLFSQWGNSSSSCLERRRKSRALGKKREERDFNCISRKETLQGATFSLSIKNREEKLGKKKKKGGDGFRITRLLPRGNSRLLYFEERVSQRERKRKRRSLAATFLKRKGSSGDGIGMGFLEDLRGRRRFPRHGEKKWGGWK